MKVYHASMVRVEHPDVLHSRKFLDFGQGFYVTTLREQAVKYAQRFIRRGKEAWLNVYELDEQLITSSYSLKEFEKYDEEWLDFVVACRKGNVVGDYDIIQGGIANDKVFRTVDLFFAGDITKEEALRRLLFEIPNNQLCVRSQKLLDNCLVFKESIRLCQTIQFCMMKVGMLYWKQSLLESYLKLVRCITCH